MEHAKGAVDMVPPSKDLEKDFDSLFQLSEDSIDHDKEWQSIVENESAAADSQKTSWSIKFPLREVKISTKGGKVARQSTLDPRLARKNWHRGMTKVAIARTFTAA